VVSAGRFAISAGVQRPLEVKVGDHVIFGKYAGNEIKADGETLVIMTEADVLAVRRAKA
jgi:chaperonin GroES